MFKGVFSGEDVEDDEWNDNQGNDDQEDNDEGNDDDDDDSDDDDPYYSKKLWKTTCSIRSKGLEWVAGEFRQLLRIKIPRMSPDPDDMSSESDEEMEEDRDEGGD